MSTETLYYKKNMDWLKFNDLVEQEIVKFMDIYDPDGNDDWTAVIELLQNCGVEFDACSNCGAMPMNSNCNNSECQQ